MFIKKIRLQAFGRLTGTCDFKRGQCNILCQDNEFGKTTLMDAVLFGLYDFPSTGYKRAELKPKDRYRPWNGEKNGGFVVELDIVTSENRELRLRADFTRQNPFELTDLQTWQKLPLEGTFGQRYFRMPLQSFTGCFFYRQDERGESGRDDLIRVIEEAAASNQRQQPSSVRQAISALSDARLHMPEFSADAIQVENLVKRIDEKIELVRRQLAELEQDRTARASEIESASRMDVELRELDCVRAQLQYAALLAELDELESALKRHEQSEELREQREARLAELQPYRAFAFQKRSELQSLYGDWRNVSDRAVDLSRRISEKLEPEVTRFREELSGLPGSFASLEASALDHLRSWRGQLVDRRRQAADERRRAESMDAELRGRGIPVEELDSAMSRLEQLNESERQTLLDPTNQRSDAEGALADVERRSAEARAVIVAAKAQRNQLRTFSGAAVTFAAAAVVAGIVLIFANYIFAGSGLIVIGLLGAGLSLGYFAKLQREVVKNELEPAAAQEISLNSEAQKLKEQLAELQMLLEEVTTRHSLDEDDVKRLRTAIQWLQMAGPYQAARDAAVRLAASAAEIQQSAFPTVQMILPQISNATEINEAEFDRAVELLSRQQALSEQLARAEKDLEGARLSHDELSADLRAKRDGIAALIEPALESLHTELPQELDQQVALFDDGCEKAIRLQTMLSETQSERPLTHEQAEQHRARVEALRTQAAEMVEQRPELQSTELAGRSRGTILEELSRADRQHEDLRVRRTDLFNDCDRAVETWRREGPRLQEKLDRLAEIKREVQEFGRAVETAHRELNDIADQVFRQWATAINERVNQVLPLINPKYKDVACSNELELSAYSCEVGRRLDGRELQHLSKGARDQLQMALRVAVSEYLSSHVGNLPLVFDEPFAHWDDGRFVEGMRFLADLTERHQVILLSCHHWRYEQLKQTHPDLAKRLHFCSLTNGAVTEPEAEPTAPAPAGTFL